MLYPFKFKPLFKDYLWGGRNLEKLGKVLPDGITAESWEVSCHSDGESVISNGEYSGLTLQQLIKKEKCGILGTAVTGKGCEGFPLLVKFIDANDDLSVQVHPDDNYAAVHENGQYGKNEMWFVISARPGSALVYDVAPGTSRERFRQAVLEGNPAGCLKFVEVSAGDVLYIPAGVVHAIGKGILLAEIQQNSNVTYRVFDYDRTDRFGNKRELHIEKALEVMDFESFKRREIYKGLEVAESERFLRRFLAASRFFAAELYRLDGSIPEKADGSRFFIYTFIKGSGCLSGAFGDLQVKMGETVLVPACLGHFTLSGGLEAIKSYIPDIEADVWTPLKAAGYTEAEIKENIGGLSAE